MPMFVTVAVENNSEGTQYESDLILSSTDIELSDKTIANILLRMNGFEKKYPENVENAIRELNTYLNNISLNSEKKNAVKPKLADSVIPDLIGIVEGGDISVPPAELISKPISEEEFDAISAPKDSQIKY